MEHCHWVINGFLLLKQSRGICGKHIERRCLFPWQETALSPTHLRFSCALTKTGRALTAADKKRGVTLQPARTLSAGSKRDVQSPARRRTARTASARCFQHHAAGQRRKQGLVSSPRAQGSAQGESGSALGMCKLEIALADAEDRRNGPRVLLTLEESTEKR